MKQPDKFSFLSGIVLVLSMVVLGCESDKPMQPSSDFVGAPTCRECHESIYDQHQASGHNQHFQRIDGKAPQYAWAEAITNPVPGPPNGLDWDSILFVLGGNTAQTVFAGLDGKFILGAETRWSRIAGAWLEFLPDEKETFDCGMCHVTGFVPGESGDTGTWAIDGVSCEACHGPGRAHAETEAAEDIVVDTTDGLCVSCHQVLRDHPYPNEIEETRAKEHFGVTCVTCHDPHVSARFNPSLAIRENCWDCHESNQVSFVHK